MSFLRNIASDLRDKRLWPVAALLVAGLIAVVFVLPHQGSSASEGSAPAVPAWVSDVQAPAEPVVGPVSDEGSPAPGTHLQGHAKDPFRVDRGAATSGAGSAPGIGSVATGAAGTSPAAPSSGSAPSMPPSIASTASPQRVAAHRPSQAGGSPTSTNPAPAAPPSKAAPHHLSHAPTRHYAIYSTDVAFAARGAKPRTLTDAPRLAPLPSARHALAVFAGVFSGGRSAGFLVANGIEVAGQARCTGSSRGCGMLLVSPGHTALLRARDGSVHTLTVRRIARHTTTSASAAHQAYRRVSRAGRCLVLGSEGGLSSIAFDAKAGVLRVATEAFKKCTKAGAARHVARPGWSLGPALLGLFG